MNRDLVRFPRIQSVIVAAHDSYKNTHMAISFSGTAVGLEGYLHLKTMQLLDTKLYREDPEKYGKLINVEEALTQRLWEGRGSNPITEVVSEYAE